MGIELKGIWDLHADLRGVQTEDLVKLGVGDEACAARDARAVEP